MSVHHNYSPSCSIDGKFSQFSRNVSKSKDAHPPPASSQVQGPSLPNHDTWRSPEKKNDKNVKKKKNNNNNITDADKEEDDCAEDESSSSGSGVSGTTTLVESPGLPNYVCLCQPEPKIPRPRNAFILYRQGHQQTVIDRNPGLHNPDISRIIGEQWRAESADQKKYWQGLAALEKAKHQEQYPNYRYQPRRMGKSRLASTAVDRDSTVERYLCSRCGGRSINTAILRSSDVAMPPPREPDGLASRARHLPVTSKLALESPVRRRALELTNLCNVHVHSPQEDSIAYSPLAPGKKRRFECRPLSPNNDCRQEELRYLKNARRDALPPLQIRYSPPPPPPPLLNSAGAPRNQTLYNGRNASVDGLDLSLRPSSSGSIEGAFNLWSPLCKIKLLGDITPPYKHIDSASDHVNWSRGVVIAIEADEAAAVPEVSEWLNAYLARQNKYKPQLMEPPHSPSKNGKSVAFEEYLDLIKTWHGKSRMIIDYITQNAATRKDGTPPCTLEQSKAGEGGGKTIASSLDPTEHTEDGMPVVILPTFQLYASTMYASHIPIQDAYDPAGHWQWMATMWRGTVGPDLTIYVTAIDTKDGHSGGGGGSSKPVLHEAARCLTVHKPREGKVAEADLRRVGFEVTEWIRAIGSPGDA